MVGTLRFAHPYAFFPLARLEQPVGHELPQQRRIVELQRHRERHDLLRPIPQPRQILFRRHQRQPIAFGLGDQAFDLGLRIRMMIGEGALPGHVDAAGAQRVEESRGIADAGKRQHALAPKLCDLRLIRLQMR